MTKRRYRPPGLLLALIVLLSMAVPFSQATAGAGTPDGSLLCYAYRTVDGQYRLVVRTIHDPQEHLLSFGGDQRLRLTGLTGLGEGLAWVRNNTLYVAASPFSGALLTLGSRRS